MNQQKLNGVTRATDAELHDAVIGALGLSYDWWQEDSPSSDVDDSGNPVEDWYLDVSVFNPDDASSEPMAHGRLTGEVLWAAAVSISTGFIPYTSPSVVRECRRLVYLGAERCDFDGATSDEVLQTAVLGRPVFG